MDYAVDSIDQLNKKFLKNAELEELKSFCEKQHKEIVHLLAVNKQLEDEIGHLKNLVISNESLIIQASLTPEELICLQQINLLKANSDANELTLEETKKLETYVKILSGIRSKSSKNDEALKGLQTDDLLKVVENDGK